MDSEGPLTEGLTLKQAAQQVGCSDALIRKIVKQEGFPVVKEDAPRGGFRYLIRGSDMPALAHEVSMRRYGRKVGEGVAKTTLPPSPEKTLTEKANEGIPSGLPQDERDELIRLRERSTMLEQENARLWRQLERVTETISQLALPPAREPRPVTESRVEGDSGSVVEAALVPEGGGEGPRAKRSFWDWLLGRDRGGGEGTRQRGSG